MSGERTDLSHESRPREDLNLHSARAATWGWTRPRRRPLRGHRGLDGDRGGDGEHAISQILEAEATLASGDHIIEEMRRETLERREAEEQEDGE